MAKKRSTKKKAPTAAEAPAERPRLYGQPVPLATILGQHRAIDTLERTIEAGRLHHAWIFHGPVGVGKFTTALALAATLLDPTTTRDLSGRLAPDPDSHVQRLIGAGMHPDLHVVRKELAPFSREDAVRGRKQTNIPVEVVREFLIEPAARTRIERHDSLAAKVLIVDEAELLSNQAQDTMLKTLEEPPAGTILVLVTSNEERLLPTIRSRSQRIAFTPLSDDALGAWLSRHRESGGAHIDPEPWLLRFAEGSPGRLLRALDLGVPAWHKALDPMLAEIWQGRFPVTLGQAAAKLVDDAAKAQVEGRPEASKEAANRLAAGEMLRYLAQRARERLASGGRTERDAAAAAIESVRAAELDLSRNVSLPFVFERLALQMLWGSRSAA